MTLVVDQILPFMTLLGVLIFLSDLFRGYLSDLNLGYQKISKGHLEEAGR